MTDDSTYQADGTLMDREAKSDKDTDRRARKSDAVPGDGKIDGQTTSPVQVVMLISALVVLTVVCFVMISWVGEVIDGNPTTYWMIELIFALLCGGAGALIGGSAVVRSTLRIPGSPVHATLGGAAAMVIVGFALAYLAQPSSEPPLFALDVHDVPDRQTVGSEEYRVFVGAVNSDLTFSRSRNSVSLKIPSQVGTHQLLIAVYRPVGKDLSRSYARCVLSFEMIAGQRQGPTPIDMVLGAGERAPPAHLYFSPHYIEQTVAAALKRNESIADESCVEGRVATKPDKTPVDGHFTIQVNSAGRRILSLAGMNPLPRYSMTARDRANLDPQDTQPDLPPHARPVPGLAKVSPPANPVDPLTPSPSVGRPAETNRAGPDINGPGDAQNAEARQSGTNDPKSDPSLYEQVNAYVRGEDRDRTQLYQSWSQVAEYVVQRLRAEAAKGSVTVAPYLNLISNALGVVDDGQYLPPTLRPKWDQSVKPDRLSLSRDIPGFGRDDYQIVVKSLCSPDEDVRRAAQRLLKLYPSEHFYPTLQTLPKQPWSDRCQMGFIVETAVYYFYNRIVEYDGTFALDKASRVWISENYAAGNGWAKIGEAQDGASPLFSAMLDYACGVILLDRGEKKDALASFNQMINAIRTTGRIYPSNPQHIATALRLTQNSPFNAKTLLAALAVTPPERRRLANAYLLNDGSASLFAVPSSEGNPIGKISSDTTAHLYLRLNNWDLLEGGGQIGWAARRGFASAAR